MMTTEHTNAGLTSGVFDPASNTNGRFSPLLNVGGASRAFSATYSEMILALSALSMERHGLVFRLHSFDLDTDEFDLDYKTETGRCEAIGRIYECEDGRYRVAVHRDAWQTPMVWNEPCTSRDTSADADILTELAASIRRELTNSSIIKE